MARAKPVYRLGIIADTHGMLREKALAALQGVELILHAGDVGKPEILDSLRQIAPLVVVRGNIDGDQWAKGFKHSEAIDFHGASLYMLHDLEDLDLDPLAAGFHAVISGHSHRPEVVADAGVLYVNPGSAGPRRFNLPVTLARMTLTGGHLSAEIVSLDEPG